MRIICLAVLFCALAPAQDRAKETRAHDVRRKAAVEAGLAYLAQIQKPDGSFPAGAHDAGIVGITALCVLAFMGQGHQEGRGRYANYRPANGGPPRDVIRKGVDYLMRCSLPPAKKGSIYSSKGKPAGYIWLDNDSDSRMHGHGYATQVLGLAYGQTKSGTARAQALKTKIRLAIDVIESSQTNTGGWGYEPNHAQSHEGSITVTVVQALRIARDAGFVVDKEVHRRGLQYLRDSQKSDGSFKYSLLSDTSTPALTAAALTAMHGLGEYYSKSVRRGLRYLRERYASPRTIQWPFYARYYAAQALWRAGGEHWAFWARGPMRDVLQGQSLDRTEPGKHGSWDDRASGNRRGSHGRAYATALSVLALSVQDGYLPTFQR